MKTLKILTLSLTLFTACQSNNLPIPKEKFSIIIPMKTKQVIQVTTKNWQDKQGKLQRYEKVEDQWKKVGKEIQIILGRNGLAWGKGLHITPKNAPYIKKEGDGKAPAGLFSLGHGFGYKNFNITFPYQTYTRNDHCVDDSNSKFYNTIINTDIISKDYRSFEYMKLKNNLYKYGITVKHNPENIAQAGSCIFIHIKSKKNGGTAGCTTMKENELINILKWLKEDKNPLLLQLPQEVLKTMKLKK